MLKCSALPISDQIVPKGWTQAWGNLGRGPGRGPCRSRSGATIEEFNEDDIDSEEDNTLVPNPSKLPDKET
uniref:Uncharacterized protein n=1 Tax=Oryza rufipogon TaxID=4529 RepID=A0A0E0R6E2_ORYRU